MVHVCLGWQVGTGGSLLVLVVILVLPYHIHILVVAHGGSIGQVAHTGAIGAKGHTGTPLEVGVLGQVHLVAMVMLSCGLEGLVGHGLLLPNDCLLCPSVDIYVGLLLCYVWSVWWGDGLWLLLPT